MAGFVSFQGRIEEVLRDGDSVAVEGFSHLISCAGHAAIRRGRKRPSRVRADLQISCERNYSVERLA